MANTATSLSPNGASYACSSAQQEEKGMWRAGKEIRSSQIRVSAWHAISSWQSSYTLVSKNFLHGVDIKGLLC